MEQINDLMDIKARPTSKCEGETETERERGGEREGMIFRALVVLYEQSEFFGILLGRCGVLF